jgi:hypothetical protein
MKKFNTIILKYNILCVNKISHVNKINKLIIILLKYFLGSCDNLCSIIDPFGVWHHVHHGNIVLASRARVWLILARQQGDATNELEAGIG